MDRQRQGDRAPICNSDVAEIDGAELMWLEGMGHALPEGVWDELVPRLLIHVGQR
jgi:hypothetical protein